jgi:hypothetical protein
MRDGLECTEKLADVQVKYISFAPHMLANWRLFKVVNTELICRKRLPLRLDQAQPGNDISQGFYLSRQGPGNLS